MKKIVHLIAGALSLGLLFSSVIPASAAANNKSVQQKVVNKNELKLLSNQKIDEMRNQVKFQNKKAADGNTYTEASLNIDGVQAVIVLNDGQKLTDEMLTKSAKRIGEEKKASELRAQLEALQPISNTQAPIKNRNVMTTFSTPPPETDGYLLGNKYSSFSDLAALAANTLFRGALGGIFTYAAIKVGTNTPGAVAIGALAGVAGDFEPFKAHWTQERVWESWSASLGCYLEDLSITYYTDSSCLTAKTVYFNYDVRRYNSTF